ncbi:MAG TPA: flagellar biosynthesis anti-sigma factor FlgM [Bdellovibrionales bacterium]|nr:flagellar biosynthesis anti-sigma factor FlgM [Bdellovibrionales bacterium]
MKVSNTKIGNASAQTEAAKAGKAGAPKNAQNEASLAGLGANKTDRKSSANVNLSEQAQMMSRAKEIASEPMSVDEAKVARLQKMIDEGRYKVDAQSIADKLVDEHLIIPD